jgi:predicted RNA methylase
MNALDQYYTPESIAGQIISEHVKITPKICIDPTCGPGHLLKAASKYFKNVECIGIDKDSETILKLSKNKPEWDLLNADIFSNEALEYARKFSESKRCCLLVMNPPFSMGNKKSYEIMFKNEKIHTSIAMAYILRSFDLFDPSDGGFVIVPESLLYSEVDKVARELLAEHYSVNSLMDLNRKAFHGANVGAVVIQIDSRKNSLMHKVSNIQPIFPKVEIQVTRGGMQVHKAIFTDDGVPFIHTTNLKQIKDTTNLDELPKVSASSRSKKFDWAILIPRVSKPSKKNIVLLRYNHPIQLSDCVIALHSSRFEDMDSVRHRILNDWDRFLEIYKGTGARYITIIRLTEWLRGELNIINTPDELEYSQKLTNKYQYSSSI